MQPAREDAVPSTIRAPAREHFIDGRPQRLELGRRGNHFIMSAWTRRPDFRIDTRLVGLEVVPEQARESLGRRLIGRSVAPGLTWQEDFPGHAGTLGYHVKGPTPLTSASSDVRRRCLILGDSLLQIEEHPLAAQRLAQG